MMKQGSAGSAAVITVTFRGVREQDPRALTLMSDLRRDLGTLRIGVQANEVFAYSMDPPTWIEIALSLAALEIARAFLPSLWQQVGAAISNCMGSLKHDPGRRLDGVRLLVTFDAVTHIFDIDDESSFGVLAPLFVEGIEKWKWHIAQQAGAGDQIRWRIIREEVLPVEVLGSNCKLRTFLLPSEPQSPKRRSASPTVVVHTMNVAGGTGIQMGGRQETEGDLEVELLGLPAYSKAHRAVIVAMTIANPTDRPIGLKRVLLRCEKQEIPASIAPEGLGAESFPWLSPHDNRIEPGGSITGAFYFGWSFWGGGEPVHLAGAREATLMLVPVRGETIEILLKIHLHEDGTSELEDDE